MDDVLSVSARLLLVVALVLANGFFVAAEFSIIAVRRTRLEQRATDGSAIARLALKAVDNIGNYLAATQLGVTIASILLGFLGEPLLADLFSSAFENVFGEKVAGIGSHIVAVPVAFFIITVLMIVIGELAPKTFSLFRAETIVYLTVGPMEVFRRVFWPFIWFLRVLGNLALRPFGFEAAGGGAHSVHTAEEINILVNQSAQAGLLEEEEAELLSGVFSFGDRRVNEVMVPRTEVVWLERGMTIRDFYPVYREHPHSRFPVFDGTHDNAVGVVNIKDVLKGLADGSLNENVVIDDPMRAPLFIPETKFVGESFFQMQKAGQQMAIVVDEYGGTAGIVTLEMLIEELVGYVGDELRRHEEEFEKVDEKTFRVDAGMTIHDANEELEINLPEDEDYETVAGFVLSRLGRIPEPGEAIAYDGLHITVTKVDGNRIEEVTVTRE
jgi:CBS domain containing-hemolysin-like protein